MWCRNGDLPMAPWRTVGCSGNVATGSHSHGWLRRVPCSSHLWHSPDDRGSDMDVGQNGRPRGPQMEMSSLVLTIQLLGYLILTHTHITPNMQGCHPRWIIVGGSHFWLHDLTNCLIIFGQSGKNGLQPTTDSWKPRIVPLFTMRIHNMSVWNSMLHTVCFSY